jgi:uncharacterized protein YndB with AHSA1/START domain
VDRAAFTYVIYIRATREAVWAGLTEPEFTRQYWMHDNVSDWRVGSRWEHRRSDGSGVVDIVGEVVECRPAERLIVTWVPPADDGVAEKTSRVSIGLADQAGWPGGPWVQLSLEHAELARDSEMHTSIAWGWPAVLSGLKTVIECGGLDAGADSRA